ncbi:MAG: hypothetical protein WAM44_01820 [Chthoniobacterales bacterium]
MEFIGVRLLFSGKQHPWREALMKIARQENAALLVCVQSTLYGKDISTIAPNGESALLTNGGTVANGETLTIIQIRE